jgi:predicted SnoaL-like aldol condensation-catalyzing enzyme
VTVTPYTKALSRGAEVALADLAWEAVRTTILTAPRAAEPSGPAVAAVTLRAALPGLTALTAHEGALLGTGWTASRTRGDTRRGHAPARRPWVLRWIARERDPPAQNLGSAGMTTRVEAESLARRMYAAASAGDVAAVDEIFAEDFFSHPMQKRGREPVRAAWQAILGRFPDFRAEAQDILVDGDRVAVRGRVLAGGQDATLMEIFRVADGRIAELWGVSSLSLR